MYDEQIAPLIAFVFCTVSTLKDSVRVKRRYDCPTGLDAFKVRDSFFSVYAESTNRGLINERSRYVTQIQQQRPE